jgi:iron complex transport system ATP-binding protein
MTLACSNLTVRAGSVTILDSVSIALRPGDFTIMLGPNGAGKTTLLTCLAGVRAPAAGHVQIDGVALADIPPRQRARQIGYLPQAGESHWALEVQTLVSFGRLPHRGMFGGPSDADTAAVAKALAETDTLQFARRLVTELSGGERARVLLARVLAGQPGWILADEPLAHLDPAHQLDVLHLLQKAARRGIGVCVALHDLTLAARFADRIILMAGGKTVADGAAAAVLTLENLRRVYQIDADIRCDAQGLSITPVSRSLGVNATSPE